MNEDKVTSVFYITQAQYDDLNKTKVKYDALINTLMANARLNYNSTDIVFNVDNEVAVLLKGIEPIRYVNKLETLKEEKENATTSE